MPSNKKRLSSDANTLDSTTFWPQYRGLVLIALAAVVVFIIVALIGEKYDDYTVDDLGFVQLLGFGMITTASCSCFVFSRKWPASRRFYLALGYILLIYALREGDVHKAFVEHTNATKGEFYLDPDVPLAAKIGCGLFLGFFGVVAIGFAGYYAKTFVRAILRFRPWAMHLVAWGCVFAASQAIDKSRFNKIFWGEASEEVLESTAEAIMLLTVPTFVNRPEKE